jgi:hypothetical protein
VPDENFEDGKLQILKGFGGTRKVFKTFQKTRRDLKPITIPETPGLDGLP